LRLKALMKALSAGETNTKGKLRGPKIGVKLFGSGEMVFFPREPIWGERNWRARPGIVTVQKIGYCTNQGVLPGGKLKSVTKSERKGQIRCDN